MISFPSLSSPQFSTTTVVFGLSCESVSKASTSLTTSIPLSTWPKTTCFLSSHGVSFKVIKNCEPFVSLPEFAIESKPSLVWA